MTELIDNPPPLPEHKHSLNSGSFAPLYTADQYRAGEAAAFARGVAAGRNAGLEEAANTCDAVATAHRMSFRYAEDNQAVGADNCAHSIRGIKR